MDRFEVARRLASSREPMAAKIRKPRCMFCLWYIRSTTAYWLFPGTVVKTPFLCRSKYVINSCTKLLLGMTQSTIKHCTWKTHLVWDSRYRPKDRFKIPTTESSWTLTLPWMALRQESLSLGSVGITGPSHSQATALCCPRGSGAQRWSWFPSHWSNRSERQTDQLRVTQAQPWSLAGLPASPGFAWRKKKSDKVQTVGSLSWLTTQIDVKLELCLTCRSRFHRMSWSYSCRQPARPHKSRRRRSAKRNASSKKVPPSSSYYSRSKANKQQKRRAFVRSITAERRWHQDCLTHKKSLPDQLVGRHFSGKHFSGFFFSFFSFSFFLSFFFFFFFFLSFRPRPESRLGPAKKKLAKSHFKAFRNARKFHSLKLGFKLENYFKPWHSDVKLYENYAVQGLCLFNQLCAAWCCVWFVKLWFEM